MENIVVMQKFEDEIDENLETLLKEDKIFPDVEDGAGLYLSAFEFIKKSKLPSDLALIKLFDHDLDIEDLKEIDKGYISFSLLVPAKNITENTLVLMDDANWGVHICRVKEYIEMYIENHWILNEDEKSLNRNEDKKTLKNLVKKFLDNKKDMKLFEQIISFDYQFGREYAFLSYLELFNFKESRIIELPLDIEDEKLLLDIEDEKLWEKKEKRTKKDLTFAEWFGQDLTGQTYEGDIDCMEKGLTSLKGSPKRVEGYFNCPANNLTSLEGSPEYVSEYFDCAENNLTSLKGSPKYVGGGFYCAENNLTSLEGSPKYVGGLFSCEDNPNLKSLEGIGEVKGGIRSDIKTEESSSINLSSKNRQRLIKLANKIRNN